MVFRRRRAAGALLDLKMTLRLVSQAGLSIPVHPHTRTTPEGLSRECNLDAFRLHMHNFSRVPASLPKYVPASVPIYPALPAYLPKEKRGKKHISNITSCTTQCLQQENL